MNGKVLTIDCSDSSLQIALHNGELKGGREWAEHLVILLSLLMAFLGILAQYFGVTL